MTAIIEISWGELALFGSVLLIPVMIDYYYQLRLAKEALFSLFRMVIQLVLIGVYLEYLFELNALWVNLIWLLVMVLVGSSAIINKAKLPKRPLLASVSIALMVGLLPLIVVLCFALIQPTPWYSAQYVIPLAGMLLGNTLGSNIIVLQNLFSALEQRWSEYEAAIALGASPRFAVNLFVRESLQKALAPILASMATTGVVTLPGMMTGQILSGISPMIAIKYQIIIFIAIFVMMTVSLVTTLELTLKRALLADGQLVIRTKNSH